MLGQAAVAMWWDVEPVMKAEFEDWHSHEHMPERLAIPGFLRGTRWIAASGEPSYFVLYEIDAVGTLIAGPYVERLNDPTPWSRKMMPHHRNMVRSLCRVRGGFGGGIANALATIRFSPAPGRRAGLFKWLVTDALRALPARKGLTSAYLLESRAAAGPAPTTEQKIRGMDRTADALVLIGGYDAQAVKAVLENELCADRIAPQGASSERVEGLYRPAFSLISRDRR
jgi:hypothetical protein